MYKKYLVIAYVAISVLLLSTGILEDHSNVKAHELVHHQIDLYFGCRNVTMNVTWFDGGSTTCNDENQTFIPEQETMHSFNEVIGYNLDGVITSIRMGAFFIITMFFCVAYIFLIKWEEQTTPPKPKDPTPPPPPPKE